MSSSLSAASPRVRMAPARSSYRGPTQRQRIPQSRSQALADETTQVSAGSTARTGSSTTLCGRILCRRGVLPSADPPRHGRPRRTLVMTASRRCGQIRRPRARRDKARPVHARSEGGRRRSHDGDLGRSAPRRVYDRPPFLGSAGVLHALGQAAQGTSGCLTVRRVCCSPALIDVRGLTGHVLDRAKHVF